MSISSITPYQILDSRGEPTLAVQMQSENGHKVEFSVPAGKSVSSLEPLEMRDGKDGPYNGMGVTHAIETINNLVAHKFIGYPLLNQADFDSLLLALDGTPNKKNLGANTILALSGAYLLLSAKSKNAEPWQYVAAMIGNTKPTFPRIYANLINGGKHAPGLEIQEFMVVPKSQKPSQATEQIYQFHHTIRSIFSSLYGPSTRLVGDEGGMAPIGVTTEVILEALAQMNTKQQSKFDIALDVAATSFFANGQYTLMGQQLDSKALAQLYLDWDKKFHLFSIEDPFAETDAESFKLLSSQLNKKFFVVGDDITSTNKTKIAEAAKQKLIGGVIIKPNQVGTMTETLDAITAAKAANIKVIVSHRSGETNDSFIVDLAFGVGAFGIKIGAPVRGERVSKYNRLLEIEAVLSDQAKKQSQTITPNTVNNTNNLNNKVGTIT